MSLGLPLCFNGLKCQCLAHSTVMGDITNCQLPCFRMDNAAFTDFLRPSLYKRATLQMITTWAPTVTTCAYSGLLLDLRRSCRRINAQHTKRCVLPQLVIQGPKTEGKTTHQPIYLLHIHEVRINLRETFISRKGIVAHVVIYGTRNFTFFTAAR